MTTEAPAHEGEGAAIATRDERQLTAPVAAMTDAELNRSFRVARALASSNMFKDARQAEQAFAKILMGRDLGLSPTEAMTNIHIIEGKPEMSANLQAAKVKQTPGYDYKVRELSADRAVIDFYFEDGATVPRPIEDNLLGVSEFTIEDAMTAGLEQKAGPNASPGVYKRYPRNMLFARAMSNGVAWYCPEVMGSIRVYAPGEAAEMTSEPTAAEVENAYDWSLIANEELRERVRGAVETANELVPGSWLPAKCEMTFTGRPDAALEKITAGIEEQNAGIIRKRAEEAEASEPQDAEVVEEGEGESASSEPQESAQQEPQATHDPAVGDEVQALRTRLSELEERIPVAQSDRETEELTAEAEGVRRELLDLGADVPGQEQLGGL